MTRNWLLLLLVFVSGSASLATEITASRLVGPFFGTSVLIWSVLIGMTLIYLTIGYSIGGRIADRSPHAATLYQIVAWAGFFIGVVPFVARPVGSAVLTTALLTSSADQLGCACNASAATPAVCGAAIEVPDMIVPCVPLPMSVDRMLTPGAATLGLRKESPLRGPPEVKLAACR